MWLQAPASNKQVNKCCDKNCIHILGQKNTVDVMGRNDKGQSDERAKRTLYVTGFNSKVTSKRLLEELFTQGGPVRDVTMFDSHAYVTFHDEESVSYCLALFNELELHGQKLRLNTRVKTRDSYRHINYLKSVRQKLMEEYNKLPPPDLPPKQMNSTRISRAKDNLKNPLICGNGRKSKRQHRSNNKSRIPGDTSIRQNNSNYFIKTKANKSRKVKKQKHKPKSKSRAKRK